MPSTPKNIQVLFSPQSLFSHPTAYWITRGTLPPRKLIWFMSSLKVYTGTPPYLTCYWVPLLTWHVIGYPSLPDMLSGTSYLTCYRVFLYTRHVIWYNPPRLLITFIIYKISPNFPYHMLRKAHTRCTKFMDLRFCFMWFFFFFLGCTHFTVFIAGELFIVSEISGGCGAHRKSADCSHSVSITRVCFPVTIININQQVGYNCHIL